jgi:hypothetical protein
LRKQFCANCGASNPSTIERTLTEEKVVIENQVPEVVDTESGAGINPFVVIATMLVIVAVIWFALFTRDGSSSNALDSNGDASSTSQLTATTSVQDASEAVSSPSTVQPAQTADTSGNLLPSFISEVEPDVVEINCYSADGTMESSGSGVSFIRKDNQANSVETNYHVYTGAVISGLAPTCYAVFPEAPDFSYNEYYGDYKLTLANWHYDPSTYEDAAIFTLGDPVASSVPLNPIPKIEDAYSDLGITTKQCPDSEASVGDGVTIFGYPSSGNSLGVSETVTEGIVSGILSGPIYKTNASIDHGNSGGIAILNKSGCALGIPTLGSSGLTGGIGYIQSYTLVNAAIDN